jgi:hypothetical protein
VVGSVDVGNAVAIVFLILCIFGFIVSFQHRALQSVVLVAPLILTLAAIAIGRYPHYPRASLFAVPPLVILTAKGLGALIRQGQPWHRQLLGWGMAVCIPVTVVVGLGAGFTPSKREALRSVMSHVAHAQQPHDGLYLYFPLQYAFRYYLDCACFDRVATVAEAANLWSVQQVDGLGQWDPALRSLSSGTVIGRRLGDNAADQLPDLARVPRRRRVWIVLGELTKGESQLLLHCLDRFGTRSRSFAGGGDESAAHAYLYSFRPEQSVALATRLPEVCAHS